jgi:hypothetical protein
MEQPHDESDGICNAIAHGVDPGLPDGLVDVRSDWNESWRANSTRIYGAVVKNHY